LTSAVSGTITATVSAPTVTTGDTVSLTFTNSNLGNNPVTVTYNVGGADTAATITSGLIAQINANSDLAAAGLTATTGSNSNVFNLIDSGTSQAQTTITQSETGSATESITLSSANPTTDTVTLPTPPTLIGESLNFGNGGSLSGGGSALTNIDNTISGAGTIGDASMTLTNSVNGIINANGINALHLNAGLLVNSGLIESTKSGGLVIGAGNDAVNNGTIAALVGLIDVQSALSGTGTAKISGSAQIKFEAANTHQNVVFAAGTGEELFLTNSQTFSGNISGFTGTDSIDLQDINFATGTTTATYTANSNLGGTLEITDGTHTTDLSMVGTYSQASFSIQNDGTGKTLLLDPPVDTANHTIAGGAMVTIAKAGLGTDTFAGKGGTLVLDLASDFAGKISGFGGQDRIDLADIGFGAQTTLGYSANGNGGGTLTVSDAGHIAKIALLGNYMASSFAVASDGHGGTLIEAAASTSQNALALPHA
jgi:hypothetical protein